MKPCKHRHALVDRCRNLGDGLSLEYCQCMGCGAWLHLGTSNDAPEAVQIEIRAPEIAAGAHTSQWENFGAGCHEHGLDADFVESSCYAGYLAHVIATHDPSQLSAAARERV